MYFFNIGTGQQIVRLTSPHSVYSGAFGYSLSASEAAVVVGAPGETGAGGLEGVGLAYVYDTSNGTLVAELRQSDEDQWSSYDFTGWSVAVDRGTVIVGSPEQGSLTEGEAYRFEVGPKIVSILGSRVVEAGGPPVVFSLVAERTLSYQWRKDGVELTDGGPYSGATTPDLSVDPTLETEGEYDVVFGSEFGTFVSPVVALGIRPGCIADADNNGVINTRDVIAFLNAWNAGCP